MRNLYIVSYDISDPTRLRQVHRKMKAYGDKLQYSVFLCEINDKEKNRMISTLTTIIKHNDDQVLIIPLGPPDGYNIQNIQSIGQPFARDDSGAAVY